MGTNGTTAAATFRNHIFQQSVSEHWPVPDGSIDLLVTSPPYWQQRDNGSDTSTWWTDKPDCPHAGAQGEACPTCGGEKSQLGQERDPRGYVRHLVQAISREAKRALQPDGQLWINIGDTYSKGVGDMPWAEQKQRLLIPYRVAMALQDEGWILRSELIWAKGVAFEDGTTKGGGMPSAVHDRLNHCHEVFFGFVKPHDLRRPYYQNDETGQVSWKKFEGSSKVDYHANMDPIRLKPIWVNENGERTDFYGRTMGSVTNAGGSPKQHGLSQPNLYMQNHPVGKNPGSVWQIKTDPFVGQELAHTAPYPRALIERLVAFGSPPHRCGGCNLPLTPTYSRAAKAHVEARCGCSGQKVRGVVFDPFMGSGTSAIAAAAKGRDYVGLELNPIFAAEARKRAGAKVQDNLLSFPTDPLPALAPI